MLYDVGDDKLVQYHVPWRGQLEIDEEDRDAGIAEGLKIESWDFDVVKNYLKNLVGHMLLLNRPEEQLGPACYGFFVMGVNLETRDEHPVSLALAGYYIWNMSPHRSGFDVTGLVL